MTVSSILMPKLGLTMTEGMLAAWHVGPGQTVQAGDLLFVVETDKIATEVTARGDGRIEELKVAEGATVDVGAVVATWTGPATKLDPDEEPVAEGHAGEAKLEEPPISAAAPSAPSEATSGTRLRATPLARRIAGQNDISLEAISGSGPRGRIKSVDVQAYLDAGRKNPESAAEPAVVADGSVRAASNFEKTVARRLTEAKQQIPHFYVMAEVDLTSLSLLRATLNSGGRNKISVNHLILLAVGRSLRERPDMSCIWRDGDIVTLGGSDLGVAVDTPRGLFAPVLRNVGNMRIDELAEATNAAAARARKGLLGRDELSGGAVTVSNVGMFGASWLIPIINPGQSAIIGVGAATPQFRPDADGAPVLCQIMSITLSGDHRVLDGVKAAQFLDAVARLLERPIDLVR